MFTKNVKERVTVMAYNNYGNNNYGSKNYGSNNYGNNKFGGGYQNNRNGFDDKKETIDMSPMKLPENCVDEAEKVILELSQDKKPITTNKIRNLLSLITDAYNRENIRTEDTLLEESINNVTMFRIRTVYEAGRDDGTKIFVKKSKIINYAKDIGNSRKKLIEFSRYMEALVAYHRFIIGGKEG